MSERRLRQHIPASHPALPGHFPGRPLVPGVVLLDRVVDAIRADEAGGEGWFAAGFPAVKFVRALEPGMEFDIVWEAPGAGGLQRFRCEDAQGLLVQGTLSRVRRR